MAHTTVSSLEAQYREAFPRSEALSAEGRKVFPGGVTHDGRYLRPFPVYVERSAGSKKYTVEGRELVDCWSGHGALLLGHAHPAIVEAVTRQMPRGTHWSACHELEMEWARRVIRLIPSAERVRFTSSGTEATLMALRVARIVTGRTKVLKFAGHFHGWHDQLSPAAEPPHDDPAYPTPGIPIGVQNELVIVKPNDVSLLERALDEHQPACVILEPTGGRWGAVPIRGEFLRTLRDVTRARNVLLIFDEVITGFRVSPGGAQGHYAVTPDLTTLAKVLAGGLPGGCLAGRADLMQALEYDNPWGRKMKHPGTFNGNPLSAAAGIAALDLVATGAPCERANAIAAQMRRGLNALFAERDAPWVAYGDFSWVKIRPQYSGPPADSDDFLPYGGDFDQLDRQFDSAFQHAFRCALLLGGVDWMGWHGMISAAHDEDDVQRVVSAFANAIALLRNEGW